MPTDRQLAKFVYSKLSKPDVAVWSMSDAVHNGIARSHLIVGYRNPVAGGGVLNGFVNFDDVIRTFRPSA